MVKIRGSIPRGPIGNLMLPRKVSKHELIGDALILLVAIVVSGVLVFVFDIHWSFYPGEEILPPSKKVFTTWDPYLIGILVGGIIGFFIIKLLFYAFMEEEIAVKERRNISRKKS